MHEKLKKPAWKYENKQYLVELERFLDKVDNIENEKLKEDIIYQMHKCDDILTKICEKELLEHKK